MKEASIARRVNTAEGQTEYWSNLGWVTDIDQASFLPDDGLTGYPILTENNTISVSLAHENGPETTPEAWRTAVLNRETERGFREWRKALLDGTTAELLVGIGQIDVYVYVDPAAGKVVRVVASDESLQHANDLVVRTATGDETPLDNTLAAVTQDGRRYFRQIATSQAWPTWEFSW